MSDTKVRFFLRDESGEPAVYCGDTPEQAAKAIGDMLESQLECLAEDPLGDEATLKLSVERQVMNDQEVASLPEL